MSFDAYEARDTEQDVRHHLVRMVGTGAAAPTSVWGRGITITRQAEGVYRLTWADNPGRIVGFAWGINATTPANVKGHSVNLGTPVAATATSDAYVDVHLWDSAFAADDLEALEWINLDLAFKLTGP